MANFYFLLPFLLTLSTQQFLCNCEFTYTAVAPFYIIPGEPYQISTTLEKVDRPPVTFKYEFTTQENSVPIFAEKIRLAGVGHTATTFTGPPNLLPDDLYYLRLTATDAAGIQKSSLMSVRKDARQSTILIQTDKPIYKAGEVVKFRAFLLNGFLRPFEADKYVDITVLDPMENVIKLWKSKEVSKDKGFVSEEFELSKEPMLGNWNIEVKTGNGTEKEYLTFPVSEYVLPKYKVEMSTSPSFVTFDDSKFTAEVRAMYSYGKPLTGECTVELSSLNNNTGSSIRTAISKTAKLEEGKGVAKISFHVTSDILISGVVNDEGRSLHLFASCTDQVSGDVRNTTETIKMYKTPYKIELVEKPKDILPGLPVDIVLKVATRDNHPVSDDRPDALKIKVDENEPIYRPIPATGLVPLYIPGNTGGYDITVEYKLTKDYFWLSSPFLPAGDYVQLKLVTPNAVEGQHIDIDVKASKQFQALNFVLISNGLAVHSKRVDGKGSTEQVIRIKLPTKLSPKVKLLVYLFCNDNIISNVLDLNVRKEDSNALRISMSDAIVQPGGNISINVNGQPSSVIGLRAVDQSVLLLQRDEDLTPEKLEDAGNQRSPDGRGNVRHLPGGDFFVNGLGIMSNLRLKTFRVKLDDETRSYSRGESAREETNEGDLQPPTLPEPPVPTNQPSPIVPVRVRSNFPETWIWKDFENAQGQLTIQKSVPDTITSWHISGFQINKEHGLDLARETPKLTVFQPFFISLNLPYSVVKGEVLLLQVLVHNYQEEGVTVNVTLENQEDGFKFFEEEEAGFTTMMKTVSLKPNSVSSAIFPIVSSKFGTITLFARAVAESPSQSVAGDAVRRTLIVRPPGIKHTQNSAVFINFLKNKVHRREKILADFPKERVSNADFLKVQVVGDVLGGTMENLDKLIKLPTGCGEQNMVKFAPDVIILDYLNFTGQLTSEVKTKTKKFLEKGYQQQLKFQRPDGSFSVWGKSDKAGSTWLTSFVTKTFIQAKRYISIEDEVIKRSLRFLLSKQNKDGSFTEGGFVYDKRLQGGVETTPSNQLAITAYTLQAIVEAQKAGINLQDLSPSRKTAKQIIDAGVQFLVDQTKGDDSFNDVYTINLISYTLHYIDHTMEGGYFLLYHYFLKLTEELARRNRHDGTIFWRPIQRQTSSASNAIVNPATIEMTSYGLLTYLLRQKGKFSETISVAKWLMKQRNPQGGFLSTQDTIMGITALAKFAEAINTKENYNTEVAVKLSYGESNSHTFHIGKDNRTMTQEYILPEATTEVGIEAEATGKGTAMVQLTWTYYVEAVDSSPAFELKTELTLLDEGLNLNMTIQYAYIGVGAESNMAILEANAPSGFAFDLEELERLRKDKAFSRYELEDKDSKLQLYFDFVEMDPETVELKLYRTHLVAMHARGVVKIYDYYDNTQKAQDLYDVPSILVCDVCKADPSCELRECQQQQNGNGRVSTS